MDNSSTHRTPKKAGGWQKPFLDVLCNSANVRAACEAAGISRSAAYAAKTKGVTFSKAWDDAIQDAADVLEAEAWRRARAKRDKDGNIIVQGSDTLLIFLLKAHRPDKYREQLRVSINVTGIAERIADEFGLPVFDVLEEADKALVRQQEQG